MQTLSLLLCVSKNRLVRHSKLNVNVNVFDKIRNLCILDRYRGTSAWSPYIYASVVCGGRAATGGITVRWLL